MANYQYFYSYNDLYTIFIKRVDLETRKIKRYSIAPGERKPSELPAEVDALISQLHTPVVKALYLQHTMQTEMPPTEG